MYQVGGNDYSIPSWRQRLQYTKLEAIHTTTYNKLEATAKEGADATVHNKYNVYTIYVLYIYYFFLCTRVCHINHTYTVPSASFRIFLALLATVTSVPNDTLYATRHSGVQ